MKRDALLVLYARGFLSALMAWKALLLVLLLNAVLSLALVGPVVAALGQTLDRNPYADRLAKGADVTFYNHFVRSRPDVLGDTGPWDDLVSGNPVKRGLLGMQGASGSLLWLGLVNALLASVFAGGFAGRFGASRDRGSLSAFGADAGRFAFSSLVLGVLSVALIACAYRFIFAASADLYEPSSLRYEWESIALSLLRLLAFLVAASLVRLLVHYARAAIGISRNGNPFLALASGAGFVLGRPVRTMALEVLYGMAALAPLVLWGLLAPVWNGRDPVALTLLILAQQALVFLRILARVANLGAASAYMSRAAEAANPAPEKLDGAAV